MIPLTHFCSCQDLNNLSEKITLPASEVPLMQMIRNNMRLHEIHTSNLRQGATELESA